MEEKWNLALMNHDLRSVKEDFRVCIQTMLNYIALNYPSSAPIEVDK